MGYDSSDVNCGDDECFVTDATSINNCHWKAFRAQALASGTMSYFKMRACNVPSGCTDDDGCWAIYADGTNAPGTLLAYTCFEGYNWTTDGVGDHTWNVENTPGSTTLTVGTYYWLVLWSYAVDGTEYSSAGCASQILGNRGQDDSECYGSMTDMQYAAQCTATSPPDGPDIENAIASYFAWGVHTTGVITEKKTFSGIGTGVSINTGTANTVGIPE